MIRLSYLREYPGWQDNGQLPKEDPDHDPGLTDDTRCILYMDGTVKVYPSPSFIIKTNDVSAEWLKWIKDNKL